MSLSHARRISSTRSEDVFNHLLENVKSINKRAGLTSFAELELELHKTFAEAERQCMQRLLQQYDWNQPLFTSQGQVYRRASRNNKRYMTLAGEVVIQRSLYRTERNGPTHCPMEQNSGLIEGFWTPQAAKQAIHLVSQLTPAEAEGVFKEFGLMAPSKSSLDRLPKKLSKHWEANRQSLESRLQDAFEIPASATLCAVSLDGVLIPTRYPRILPSDSRWAEASCGTVSFFDNEGALLSTRYLARMPEHKKKTMKQQLAAQIQHVLTKHPELKVVKIADGARDNWTFLDEQVEAGECVLDFYHASQHLFSAMEALYGKGAVQASTAHKKYRDILLYDEKGIHKVINHLKYHQRSQPQLKALKTELTYFTRNKSRCHYARLKEQNKPIGSGIVESACKTVVQMRLKRSGQHWDDAGGQSILTFRAILRSGQLNDAWEYIKGFYLKPVELPENVVNFPRV